MIEILETRRLMDATVQPNPGNPQSAGSGNLVAVFMSGQTGNGAVISQAAQAGVVPTFIHDLLAFSNPPRGPFA
jgi:hypothetical protein